MAEDGGRDEVRPDEDGRLGARFAKLWAASTTSALGSGLAIIAAPLYVASRTSSPLIVSGATGVAWLPWLLPGKAIPGTLHLVVPVNPAYFDAIRRAAGLIAAHIPS